MFFAFAMGYGFLAQTKHHIPQAKNIPYQPLLMKPIYCSVRVWIIEDQAREIREGSGQDSSRVKGRSNKNLRGRTELLSLYFKILAMINRKIDLNLDSHLGRISCWLKYFMHLKTNYEFKLEWLYSILIY